jgi:hypothetical protein
MLGFQRHRLSRHSFVSLATRSLLRPRSLEWLRSFPDLLVVHNFRCAHRQSALAERANLLAKRARSSGAKWRPYLIETTRLSKALGFYDMVALPLATVDEVEARAKANPLPFDLFLGTYWRSCREQDAQEYLWV